MKLSSLPVGRGADGPDVVEIQIRLAGFRGTMWDGSFGPGTELQVMAFQRDYLGWRNGSPLAPPTNLLVMPFQRDYLGSANPNGIVDRATWDGLEKFAAEFPVNFQPLSCPCGRCPGFGNGSNDGVYYPGKPKIEMNYRYEYPGIHKAILNTYRAAQFYGLKAGYGQAIVNSGYRCTINNEQNHRETTNHMGKALDIDFPLRPGEGKREDCERCDSARGILVEKANCQIGWGAANRKSLEPSDIAPSWVHMDVRSYEMKYLDKSFFVKTAADLDRFE